MAACKAAATALPGSARQLAMRSLPRAQLQVLDFVGASSSRSSRGSSTSTAEGSANVFSTRAKITHHCLTWLKSSRLRQDLDRNFELSELYKGDLSSVVFAKCRANGECVIIKSFPKHQLLARPDLQTKVRLEWDIHSSLDHPHVIRAYLAQEMSDMVGLFMECAGDSDAYSYLTAKQREALREADARQLVWGTLDALRYLHEQGVVHRDVKSENVFRTADGTWKLGDFGSALRLGERRAMERQALKLEGTFSFAAPEYVSIWSSFTRAQLIEATSFKLDSWSVGALAYDVLVGHAPFSAHDKTPREEESRAILSAEPQFPSGLSYSAVSFMKQALEKDPQKRPTIRQLMAHPWFDG